MSGQNGQGAVHLLSQYDASQLMWQGDATKRKKHVGTLARGRRPPIRRANGEHQALDSLVADTAEPRSELIRGVLLAATIQQNRIRGSATGLPIQPVEDRRLRIEQLGLARRCIVWRALYSQRSSARRPRISTGYGVARRQQE